MPSRDRDGYHDNVLYHPCGDDKANAGEGGGPPVFCEPLPGGGERPLAQEQVLQPDERALGVDLTALAEDVAVTLNNHNLIRLREPAHCVSKNLIQRMNNQDC